MILIYPPTFTPTEQRYYCHIFADPQDAKTVYITNLKMWKSTDDGTNYNEIKRFTPKADKTEAGQRDPSQNGQAYNADDNAVLPTNAGLNRFVWDMRYPEAAKVPGDLTTQNIIAATGMRASAAGDRLRTPARLNTKLIGLISIVTAADARPTKQA